MAVRILGSAVGGPNSQHLTSYVVNDNIASDAGALGLTRVPGEQARIRHIFLTHRHLDRFATLPVFLENSFGRGRGPVAACGHSSSLAVDHMVAAYGYIVTHSAATVLFSGDAGPGRAYLAAGRRWLCPKVCIPGSVVPDSMHNVAHGSRHRDPRLLAAEVAKMPETRAVTVVHIKSRFREKDGREPVNSKFPNLTVGAPTRGSPLI